MSRAAVLGRPVAHSLSPLLHRAAYAALGLTDWTYDALDIGADDLAVLLAGLGEEWRGFSVTMPCKQAAVDVADVVEPLPRLLHAANTLVRTEAGWRAENTDVGGIGMALQIAGVAEVGAATIIGAGGTAAAAAVAVSSLGAEHVDVVVRDPARAGDVSRVLDVLEVPFTVTPLASAALDSPLVVSTVPIAAQPDLLHLPWRAGHTVLDVLYAPWPTPLAQRVAAVGGTVAGGLDVLFWQATAQVELMTGHAPPLAAMRTALDAAVGAR
jgi:shikimate dehydrogenase